jgi:hypothetical protein
MLSQSAIKWAIHVYRKELSGLRFSLIHMVIKPGLIGHVFIYFFYSLCFEETVVLIFLGVGKDELLITIVFLSGYCCSYLSFIFILQDCGSNFIP